MTSLPEPPTRSPRSSAAADAGRDALRRAGERLRELLDSLRRSDRHARMRLGIIGAWAVLSLGTLWGACATPGSGSTLGADVQVNRDSIMGVQVLVRNESSQVWEDVVLTLDDRFRYAHPTMRPHDLVVLPMTAFKKGDEAPPRDYRPRTLAIRCGQGSDRFELR